MTLELFDKIWSIPLLVSTFGLLGMQVLAFVRNGLRASLFHLWPWHIAVALVWTVQAVLDQMQGSTAWMVVGILIAVSHGCLAVVYMERYETDKVRKAFDIDSV